MGGGPETGGAIGGAGEEVMAERRELEIPDRSRVGAIYHELVVGGEVPQPDGGVG